MDREIQQIVEKHKTSCVVGSPSVADLCPIGCSKKGGFPDVCDDFEWPNYEGKHLSFLVQIEAKHFLGEGALGTLQFFWNKRNWGGSIKDDGSFRVLRSIHPSIRLKVVPETEHRKFGLFRRTHSPTIWKEEALVFRDSFSLPSIERLEKFGYNWDYDRDDLYHREAEALAGFFRIGGFPFPIQSDDMEKDCERIRNLGPRESWRLLLEIDSQSDMMWGDGGKLYWFIRQDELDKQDFTKVWMHTQCH
ncbi:MAG TPA: YwqG family protein [Bacteroidia bacterium]|nr:YwqG family protein [Bacteroidia bacterium]